jgi:uncharacterized protein
MTTSAPSSLSSLQREIITKTTRHVQHVLKDAEAGHDWWHMWRVVQSARHIARFEPGDKFIVELGALLHDIADSKFYNGDEEVGPRMAREFLETQDVSPDVIDHVEAIIRNISYKNTFATEAPVFRSPELSIVQDADRLDAIGAIGIARTFHFGGFKNREMYNPAIAPNLHMSKEEYKKGTGPTINHFYEKLLLLKDTMNTATGRTMAEARHAFMEAYLAQFYVEWKGEK